MNYNRRAWFKQLNMMKELFALILEEDQISLVQTN